MVLLASAILLLAGAAPKPPVLILFIGNSHTEHNDLPAMVKQLLESDGTGRKVGTYRYFAPFLNDAFTNAEVRATTADPKWDFVVLQGAKISSSHKFVYNNDGANGLVRIARKGGSRALFFVEWPRRGWDESDYQTSMYRGLKKITPGAELVPVCYAWDIALKRSPNLMLWEHDGNHASALGTYLASNVFYYYIAGLKGTPTWTLAGVPPATAHLFRASAKRAVAEHPNR